MYRVSADIDDGVLHRDEAPMRVCAPLACHANFFLVAEVMETDFGECTKYKAHITVMRGVPQNPEAILNGPPSRPISKIGGEGDQGV